MYNYSRSGVATILLLIYSSMTLAQESVIEEVIVTAQKRAQSLADVPVSVAAVSGEKITDNNINRLDELARFIPNLQINENLTGNAINIRGISSGVGNSGFEQSVATFIDGVYFGRARQSVVPFMDVQQVEVLRGPQPVFFGNSAVAGALNIATRDPSLEQWEGDISASYGSDSEYTLEAAVGGPVTDHFGIRLAARTYGWDGWMENSVSGDELPERENDAVRIVALYEKDLTKVRFKYEWADQEQTGLPQQITNCGQGGLNPAAPGFLPITGNVCEFLQSIPDANLDLEFRANDQGAAGPNRQAIAFGATGAMLVDVASDDLAVQPETLEAKNAQLLIEHDFDNFTFTSLTGWTDYDSYRMLDIDNTPVVYFTAILPEDFEQTSQEFRLTSSGEGSTDWMVGVYWQDAELDAGNNAFITPVPFVNVGTGVLHNEENTWFSVFGATTFHFADVWHLGLGVRYTDVEKEGEAQAIFGTLATTANPLFGQPNQPPEIIDWSASNLVLNTFQTRPDAVACLAGGVSQAGVCRIEDHDTDDINWSVDLQWDATDRTMAYLKISDAFKAGGFNVGNSVAVGDFTYEDEESLSIEIGAKYSGERVNFNVALFTTEYDNLQLSSFDTGLQSFNIGNAGESTTTGLEFDGTWAATDNFRLTFSGALLDTEFDSFEGAQCSDFERNRNLNGCSYAAGGAITDRSGEELNYAPDLVLNVAGEYVTQVSDALRLTLGADINWSDEYWVNDRYDPRGIQDAYTQINIRAVLSSSDERWAVSLLGRNITDEDLTVIYGPSAFNGTESAFLMTSRGSSYAIQARYSF